MKISIACDHGGYELKENLKKWLEDSNYEVIDYGTYNTESCDYPDFGRLAAEAVANTGSNACILWIVDEPDCPESLIK